MKKINFQKNIIFGFIYILNPSNFVMSSFPIIHILSKNNQLLKTKSFEYREMSFLNIFRKLGFCKMNKLTNSSSNNEVDDDTT
jgi:hypothetical protein